LPCQDKTRLTVDHFILKIMRTISSMPRLRREAARLRKRLKNKSDRRSENQVFMYSIWFIFLRKNRKHIKIFMISSFGAGKQPEKRSP